MNHKILGISGKRGGGKTTLADYLKTKGFIKQSFASVLRELSDDLWTPDDNNAMWNYPKEKPFKHYSWTPREFMIDFGQFMRKYDPDYWLNPVVNVVRSPGLWVIDDVRFPNEYDALKAIGATMVRLERKEELNIYGKNLDDISETALDNHKFDYTLSADKNLTIKDLHEFGDMLQL